MNSVIVEKDIIISMLKEFRLPTMGRDLEEVVSLAEDGNWSYRQYLQELCEREQHARHGCNQKKLQPE